MTEEEIAAAALALCVDRGLNPTHAHMWGDRPSGHTNSTHATQEVRVEVERKRVERVVSRKRAVHFQERSIYLPTYGGHECLVHIIVWLSDRTDKTYEHEVAYPEGKADIKADYIFREVEEVTRVLWRTLEP